MGVSIQPSISSDTCRQMAAILSEVVNALSTLYAHPPVCTYIGLVRVHEVWVCSFSVLHTHVCVTERVIVLIVTVSNVCLCVSFFVNNTLCNFAKDTQLVQNRY